MLSITYNTCVIKGICGSGLGCFKLDRRKFLEPFPFLSFRQRHLTRPGLTIAHLSSAHPIHPLSVVQDGARPDGMCIR
jgi:hypothetical protein